MKKKHLRLMPYALCLLAIGTAATACRPMRVYRVTFTDGTYDYYELN